MIGHGNARLDNKACTLHFWAVFGLGVYPLSPERATESLGFRMKAPSRLETSPPGRPNGRHEQ